MGLLDYLLPWRWQWQRQRHEAEKKTDEEFRNQIKEAVLNQQTLMDAVAQMKRVREDQEAMSTRFRPKLHSR